MARARGPTLCEISYATLEKSEITGEIRNQEEIRNQIGNQDIYNQQIVDDRRINNQLSCPRRYQPVGEATISFNQLYL